MLYSMTGFGKSTVIITDKTVTIEMKSLNSKGLDINIKLPRTYKDKEMELRKTLSKSLYRGKIDLYINIDSNEDVKSHSINKSLVKSYFSELKSLSKELKIEQEKDILNMILQLPNVIYAEKDVFDEKEWRKIKKAINESMDKLIMFRKQEGTSLEKELRKRIKKIELLLGQVIQKEPVRTKKVRNKLLKNLDISSFKRSFDSNRFEQEIIYYIEKLDITEEMVRLKNHVSFFIKELSATQVTKGKKMGFICQEIGREINTIGSKANDAILQKVVIQMKDELEKIKEQIDNIL